MAKTEFTVAIELSSSRITGIAGTREPNGTITVRAFAEEDASRFVKKGVTLNINEAAKAMDSIVGSLEKQLSHKIAKVYLSISGQTVRTVKNEVRRTADDGGIVTEDLINEINDENRNYPIVDACILDVIPQEYDIDNTLVIEPIGVAGHNVKATLLNVVARSYVKNNLTFSAEQAQLTLADDLIVGPKALAEAVLTETEKRSGCALVDFGAATTTVAVYKNNLLRYLSVLPLGSENITRDLTALRIEEDEARHLKEEYGDALGEGTGEAPSGFPIKEWETFNDLITARTEEILKNVWNQILQSGYASKLFAGIVLTGGGSNLHNMEEAFRKYSSQSNVKTVKSPNCNVVGSLAATRQDATLNTVYGMLQLGNENCCAEEEPTPAAVNSTPTFDETASTSGTIESGNLFADDEEYKRQEEEALRQKMQEEEERQRKQKEAEAKAAREKRERDKERRNIFKKIGEKLGGISRDLFDDNSEKMYDDLPQQVRSKQRGERTN